MARPTPMIRAGRVTRCASPCRSPSLCSRLGYRRHGRMEGTGFTMCPPRETSATLTTSISVDRQGQRGGTGSIMMLGRPCCCAWSRSLSRTSPSWTSSPKRGDSRSVESGGTVSWRGRRRHGVHQAQHGGRLCCRVESRLFRVGAGDRAPDAFIVRCGCHLAQFVGCASGRPTGAARRRRAQRSAPTSSLPPRFRSFLTDRLAPICPS
jgi:hypothetical protein